MTLHIVKTNHTDQLTGHPMPGIGKRAMGCDKYDTCLYKAAVEDWDSFNCDACRYEDRGVLETIEPVYLPELDESGDLETELVALVFSLGTLDLFKEDTSNDHAA